MGLRLPPSTLSEPDGGLGVEQSEEQRLFSGQTAHHQKGSPSYSKQPSLLDDGQVPNFHEIFLEM